MSDGTPSLGGSVRGGGSRRFEGMRGSSLGGRSVASSGMRVTGSLVGELPAMTTLENALFGVVHTLGRKKSRSVGFAVLTLGLNTAQLLAVVLEVFDGRSVAARASSTSNPLDAVALVVASGWPAFARLVVFTSLLTAFAVGIGVLIAGSFSSGHFPYVWPLKAVRVLERLFIGLFYITLLNVLLLSVDCDGAGFLVAFPEQGCWTADHLPLAFLSVGVCAVVLLSALVLALVSFSPFTADTPMATPNPQFPFYYFVGRTAAAVGSTVLGSQPKLLAPLVTAVGAWLLYQLVTAFPYYHRGVNRLGAACYAAVTAAGLCATLFAYWGSDDGGWLVYAMWAPMLAAAAFAFDFCRRRDRASMPESALPRGRTVTCTLAFASETEVEFHSRLVLDVPGSGSRKVVDAIILRGLALFPESAFLTMLYSEFLDSFGEDSPRATIYADKLRRLSPSFQYRYWLFARAHQRRMQQDVTHTTSLVTYVEFQNQYRDGAAAFAKTVQAMHLLWRRLCHRGPARGVPVVVRALRRIMLAERRAQLQLDALSTKYPRSPKVMRLRANFLSLVKHDHEGAQLLYSEAERSDDAGVTRPSIDTLDEYKDTILILNSTGIIRDANQNATRMFGRRRDQLVGSNVKIVMPSPFRETHDQYLHKYIQTGISGVIGHPRTLWAINHNDHAFPIQLLVTPFSQPDGVLFAGVIHELQPKTPITVFANAAGVVHFATAAFYAAVGYTPAEVAGKPLSRIVQGLHSAVADGVYVAITNDGQAKRVSLKRSEFVAGGHAMHVIELSELEDRRAVLEINAKGKIIALNASVLSLLGYEEGELAGCNVAAIIPGPYAHFHAGYLDRFVRTGNRHFSSESEDDLQWRAVRFKHKDGHLIQAELSIVMVGTRTNNPTFTGFIKLSESTTDIEAETEERLARATIARGTGNVIDCNTAFARYLDASVPALIGQPLSALIPSVTSVRPGFFVAHPDFFSIQGEATTTTTATSSFYTPSARQRKVGKKPTPPPNNGEGPWDFCLTQTRSMECLVSFTPADGIVDMSRAFCLLVGVPRSALLGKRVDSVVRSLTKASGPARVHTLRVGERDVVVATHSSGDQTYCYGETAQNADGVYHSRLDVKLSLEPGFDAHEADAWLAASEKRHPDLLTRTLGSRVLELDELSDADADAAPSEAPSEDDEDLLQSRHHDICAALSPLNFTLIVAKLGKISRFAYWTFIVLFGAGLLVLLASYSSFVDTESGTYDAARLQADFVRARTLAKAAARGDCASADAAAQVVDVAGDSMDTVYLHGGVQDEFHAELCFWSEGDPECMPAYNALSLYLHSALELHTVLCEDSSSSSSPSLLNASAVLDRHLCVITERVNADVLLKRDALAETKTAVYCFQAALIVLATLLTLPQLLHLAHRRFVLFQFFIDLPAAAREEMKLLAALQVQQLTLHEDDGVVDMLDRELSPRADDDDDNDDDDDDADADSKPDESEREASIFTEDTPLQLTRKLGLDELGVRFHPPTAVPEEQKEEEEEEEEKQETKTKTGGTQLTMLLIWPSLRSSLVALLALLLAYAVHTTTTTAANTLYRLQAISQIEPQALLVREAVADLSNANGTAATAGQLEHAAHWIAETADALLYGSDAMGIAPALASMHDDERGLLFEPSCLLLLAAAADGSPSCYNSTSSPVVAVAASQGLDALLRRYVTAAEAMLDACRTTSGCLSASDVDSLIVWELGDADVRDGVRRWVSLTEAHIEDQQVDDMWIGAMLLACYALVTTLSYRRIAKVNYRHLSSEWWTLTNLLAAIPPRHEISEMLQQHAIAKRGPSRGGGDDGEDRSRPGSPVQSSGLRAEQLRSRSWANEDPPVGRSNKVYASP